ncbi:MAG: thiamine phosphate synthase [Planctomycetota bacterium]|jgi:thiamine-phosphate pyrophosphorylase
MERSAYRIIDANFNRGREALRVIEEFCRFSLNSATLSERTKQLRHQLCSVISRLDEDRLISSRDTIGDVGIGVKVDEQLSRGTLEDCLTAACKRLTEALRAIAEVTETIDSFVSEAVEKLRYAVYTLEKDILVLVIPGEKFKRVKLYVIITSNLPLEVISLTEKCVLGGVDCIQLRAKDIADRKLYMVAREFVEICRSYNVLSIINDRVDIAVTTGADGVHLGQNDLSIEQARELELWPLIIGKTTRSIEQLHEVCHGRPTYVSLGPVYSTTTKPNLRAVGLDYVTAGIKELEDSGIGHAAIGGITTDNVEEVLKAGAKTIAVCSAVTEDADPRGTCQALKEKITACNEVNTDKK